MQAAFAKHKKTDGAEHLFIQKGGRIEGQYSSHRGGEKMTLRIWKGPVGR